MAASTFSLSEQAANQIMDMILVQKRFQAGDKLPNELELAQELQISRVTLREAIRILCTRGFVEIQRGRGTFVTSSGSLPSGETLTRLGNMAVSRRDQLEVRLMFEPTAAYYAARRASSEELQAIRDLALKIEEVVADGQSRDEHEQNFHNAIALASHNEFMTVLTPVINRALADTISEFDSGTDLVYHSLQDHRQIVRFLEQGNAEGARAAMHLHIVRAFDINGIHID